MVNVDPSTVADAEAVDRVVLDVNIVNRTGPKDLAQLDEVVRSVNVVSKPRYP